MLTKTIKVAPALALLEGSPCDTYDLVHWEGFGFFRFKTLRDLFKELKRGKFAEVGARPVDRGVEVIWPKGSAKLYDLTSTAHLFKL